MCGKGSVRKKRTKKKHLYLFNYLPKHSIGFQYFFILNTNRYMHTSFSLFFKISDHNKHIRYWWSVRTPELSLSHTLLRNGQPKTKPVDTCAALRDGCYVTVVSETVGQRSRGSLLKLQLKWQDVKNYNDDDDVDCGGNVWYPSWMHLYLIDFEL